MNRLTAGITDRLSSLRSLERVDVVQQRGSLPVGSHLISPRRFYLHHGIYLGNGEIAHYSGLSASMKAGPIEITDFEHFSHGKSIWMYQLQCEFSNDEIARRARSRIGECQYRLFSNNCEHFCSWCRYGESYSAQVAAYIHCPRRLLSIIAAMEEDFVA